MAFATIGPVSTKSLWTLDPRTIPGCVLWLDANDSNTLVFSGGSNVQTWNDKSEFGFHMTATPASGSVTYSSNGFNGLPAIRFADNGRFSNVMQRYLFQSNITAAVVFQKTGLDSSLDTLIGRYFGSTPIFGADTSSGNVRIIGNGTTTRTFDASGSFSLRTQQPNIYVFQTGSDLSWNEFWNGTQQSIRTATDVGTVTYSDASSGNVLTIGGFGTTPIRSFNGLISEVILFNTRLNRFDRQSLEGYLANKWNMVYALASNHPFGTLSVCGIITSPTTIPTCSAWYDAADALTISYGTAGVDVSQWLNKAGNLFHLRSTGVSSNNPFYNSVEKYVGFRSASPNFLTISGGTNLNRGDSYTVFAVETRTSTNATSPDEINPIVGGTSTTNSSNFSVGYRSNTIMRHSILGPTVNSTIDAFDSNFEKNQVWTFYYNGAARRTYSNGTLIGEASSTQDLLAWPGASVGRTVFTNGSNYYNGKLKELIFYKAALIDASRESVENYLAYKWGLFSNASTLTQFRTSNPTFMRVFLPTDISGCVGWYDANDPTTITLSGTVDVSGWVNKGLIASDTLANIGTVLPKYQTDPSTGFMGVYIGTAASVMRSGVSTNTSGNTFFCVSRMNSFGGGTGIQMLYGLPDLLGGDASVRTIDTDPYWDLGFGNAQETIWSPAAGGSLYYNGGGPLTLSGRSAPVVWNTNIISSITGLIGTSRTGLSSTLFGRGMRDVYYYEFLRYNRILSSNERQKVEGYLANKWGLTTNLTANQPYSLYYGNDYLPIDVPSLAAWYDAADSTTITLSSGSTTQIARWNDKTGNGFDLSLIPGNNSPIYTSNQHVGFNGSNTGLFITNGSGLVVNQSFTIIVLEQRETSARNIFMGGSGAGTNSNLHMGYQSDTVFRFGYWNSDLDVGVPAFSTAAQPYTSWTTLYGGGVRQIYINNSLIATSNSTQNLLDWSNAHVGRFPQSTGFYSGRMREILFFRSALTSDQLSNVHSYLAWKWNLQNFIRTSPSISNIVPPNTPRPFTPLDYSGIALWYDGADSRSITLSATTATSFARWADKSGNGRNALRGPKVSAITGLNNPATYSTIGGAIFSGDQYLSPTPRLSAGVSMEIVFAVIRNPNNAASANLLGGDPLTGTRCLQFNFSTNRFTTVKQNSAEVLVTPFTALTANVPSIFCAENLGTLAAGSVRHYQDASQLLGTVVNVPSQGFYLDGSTYIGAQLAVNPAQVTVFLTASLNELIVYQNRVLTTQQRQTVEGYLAWKWGSIAALPASHPYKNNPP